jgi:hypothetical protein
LRAAERLPVEFHVNALVGEESLLARDEIVKAHSFWSNFDTSHKNQKPQITRITQI